MNNMFGNMQYLMSEYSKFAQNPVGWLTQMNFQNPQQALQNPQQTMQNAMNNGAMNNQQLNQLMSIAQMIRGMGGTPFR